MAHCGCLFTALLDSYVHWAAFSYVSLFASSCPTSALHLSVLIINHCQSLRRCSEATSKQSGPTSHGFMPFLSTDAEQWARKGTQRREAQGCATWGVYWIHTIFLHVYMCSEQKYFLHASSSLLTATGQPFFLRCTRSDTLVGSDTFQTGLRANLQQECVSILVQVHCSKLKLCPARML